MFLDIVKSFFIPMKMKRFRYMSILFAILIFIVQVYLLSFPHTIYLKRDHKKYIESQQYIATYYDMNGAILHQYPSENHPEDSLEEIKNAEYKIEENKLTSKIADLQIYQTAYLRNEEEVTVYIVFDPNDQMLSAIEDLKNKYLEKYPDTTESDASYYSQLIYIKSKKENVNGETLFEEYHQKTEEELREEFSSASNFDLFGIQEVNKNAYLLLFLKEYVLTQVPYEEEDTPYVSMSIAYNQGIHFNFSKVTNTEELGKTICESIMPVLVKQDSNIYLLQIVGYLLAYPLLLVLIMWLCLRKRGVLKRFKEYYNIASIASVAPFLITFILSWFVNNAIIYYGVIFSVFTLFCYISINSKPDLTD